MAKCDVRGLWAGIFRKRHSNCAPQESAEDFALRLADSLRASLKPLANVEITVSTLTVTEESASEEARPTASLGISFDMQPNYSSPPAASAIIDAVRERVFVGPSNKDLIDAVLGGSTERGFCQWINENGGCDRFWAEMLFGTLSLAVYSNSHRQNNFELREFLPYWELSSMTSYCKAHRRLDGLVRRWDDPVWEDIYPPNGWMCGCSVLAGVKGDFIDAPHIRVTAQTREKCRNWINSDPTKAVDMLRPSRKNW